MASRNIVCFKYITLWISLVVVFGLRVLYLSFWLFRSLVRSDVQTNRTSSPVRPSKRTMEYYEHVVSWGQENMCFWSKWYCWELPPRLNHQHTHTKSWFSSTLLLTEKRISSRSRLQSLILLILVFNCLFYHCQSLVWVSIKRFQSSRLSDSHALSITPLHLTFSQITLFIIKTKLKLR